MKKFITFALIAAMMLTMLVANVSADAWDGTTASTALEGDGSAATPYLVKSAEDLAFLAKSVDEGTTYAGKYITQTADIDLNNKEWAAIGNLGKPFSGVYDGKGHKIVGFKMTQNNINVGLFAYIIATDNSAAGIANLNLYGEITLNGCTTDQRVGPVVATISGADKAHVANQVYVINTTSNVDITMTNCSCTARVGGFSAFAYHATYENCVSNGTINVTSAKDTRIGGFYGQGSCLTFTNCVNNRDITANTAIGHNVGGFSGMHTVCGSGVTNQTVFTNCVNNGDITAVSTTKEKQVYVGGFLGGVYRDGKLASTPFSTKIVNCVNNGDIYGKLPTVAEGYIGSGSTTKSGFSYVGGIAAVVSYDGFSIEGSVNTGTITAIGGTGTRPGGIVGVMNNSGASETLYLKDCITVNKLSAYIKNPTTGCTENADPAVAAAAAKTIEDAIVPSVVRIAGFPTGYVAPPAPETTTAAPETTKAPAETTAAPAETTAAPAETTAAPVVTTVVPETTSPSTPNTGDVTSVILLALVAACAGAVITIKKTK